MDSLRMEGENRRISAAKEPKEIRLEMKTREFNNSLIVRGDASDDYVLMMIF